MKPSTYYVLFLGILIAYHQSNAFVIPSRQSSYAGHANNNDALMKSCISSSLSAAAVPSTAEKIPNQILKFQEPKTNVTVVLVGAMHYNPASIQLAEQTVSGLASNDELGCVIVESCDIRWNRTLDLYENRPWLKALLKNEMVASSDLAQTYNRPVVLGDQRINITTTSLKECFQETIKDLISPPSGWKRYASELGRAADETGFFGGPGYLNAFAFLDPKLLLAFPVSLVKYPLSFLVRDPVPTSILFFGLFGLNYLDYSGVLGEPGSTSVALETIQNSEVPLSDYILSWTISVLETVVFAKVFLKPLLAERNEVLAKSILDQCFLFATNPNLVETKKVVPANTWNLPWPFTSDSEKSQESSSSSAEEDAIVYASGNSVVLSGQDGRAKKDQTVVAVLGMAHCNGIKKLLQEEMVKF